MTDSPESAFGLSVIQGGKSGRRAPKVRGRNHGSNHSFMERFEERWRRRRDGNGY